MNLLTSDFNRAFRNVLNSMIRWLIQGYYFHAYQNYFLKMRIGGSVTDNAMTIAGKFNSYFAGCC